MELVKPKRPSIVDRARRFLRKKEQNPAKEKSLEDANPSCTYAAPVNVPPIVLREVNKNTSKNILQESGKRPSTHPNQDGCKSSLDKFLPTATKPPHHPGSSGKKEKGGWFTETLRMKERNPCEENSIEDARTSFTAVAEVHAPPTLSRVISKRKSKNTSQDSGKRSSTQKSSTTTVEVRTPPTVLREVSSNWSNRIPPDSNERSSSRPNKNACKPSLDDFLMTAAKLPIYPGSIAKKERDDSFFEALQKKEPNWSDDTSIRKASTTFITLAEVHAPPSHLREVDNSESIIISPDSSKTSTDCHPNVDGCKQSFDNPSLTAPISTSQPGFSLKKESGVSFTKLIDALPNFALQHKKKKSDMVCITNKANANPPSETFKKNCSTNGIIETKPGKNVIQTLLGWKQRANATAFNKRKIPSRAWTFEASYDAFHRKGEIHSCIASKAETSVRNLDARYVILGPWTLQASKELEEVELVYGFATKEMDFLCFALSEMRTRGFVMKIGRWKVPGSPLAILFDIEQVSDAVRERYRKELERDDLIHVPYGDTESERALVFGYLIAEFCAEFRLAAKHFAGEEEPVVFQFHDWQAALGHLFLRQWMVNVSTVFTLHSTVPGRLIGVGRADCDLHLIGLESFAGADHRHLIERLAAGTCSVLTAVSERVAIEAEHFLGRKPELLTRNGLNLPVVMPDHQRSRAKIEEFVSRHFGNPHLAKSDKTLFLFSGGPYEVREGGIDMLIESLSGLQWMFKRNPPAEDVTVIAFLLYPGNAKGFNRNTVMRARHEKKLQDVIVSMESKLGQPVYDDKARRRIFNLKNGQTWIKEDARTLDKAIFMAQADTQPPITTHELKEFYGDAILNHLRELELFNELYDRVKIVFYPKLGKQIPLFDLQYEDFISGCDLSVIPSRYASGYTAAESIAVGTPTITTNMSSFGEVIADSDGQGVFWIDLRSPTADPLNLIIRYINSFAHLSKEEKQVQRSLAIQLSRQLSWSYFHQQYDSARKLATVKSAQNLATSAKTARDIRCKQLCS